MSNYRNIKAWQRARVLSRRIHSLLRKLPLEERIQRGDHIVKTTTQIRVAIVEGLSHESPRQFARFLTYAIGSADELGDELQELVDIDVMPLEDRDLPDECHQIAAMLVDFRKVVLRGARPSQDADRRNEEPSNKSAERKLRAFLVLWSPVTCHLSPDTCQGTLTKTAPTPDF